MSPRVRFFLAGTFMLVVLKTCVQAKAQAQNQNEQNAARLYGEATLKTNDMWNGITQTDKSFALQTTVGYKSGGFRMGVWGSNVKFPDAGDNLNLRLFLAYKVSFTPAQDFQFKYDFNRYFNAGSRNGSIFSLQYRYMDHHILYEQNDKFEAVGSANRYGYMYILNFSQATNFQVNAGYNMVSATGYTSYFNVVTQYNIKSGPMTYFIGNDYNSNASQFPGRASTLMLYLGLSAQF